MATGEDDSMRICARAVRENMCPGFKRDVQGIGVHVVVSVVMKERAEESGETQRAPGCCC